jgi:hypothetical protein
VGSLAIKGMAIMPPNLTIMPSPLQFDGIPLGTQSGDKLLTVTNTGEATTGALTVPSVLGAGFVLSGHTCTAPLEATKSCSIAVRFSPAAIAEASFSFEVSSASGAVGTAVVRGTGREPTRLALDPREVRGCSQSSIDGGSASTICFADTMVGQVDGSSSNQVARAPVTFTLTFAEPRPVSIDTGLVTVSLDGANPSDFALVTSDCGPSLAPMQHCTFAVSFKPSAPGLRRATINATCANGGNTTATIEAVGLAAAAR